jgi:hypothetical protein
LKYAFRVVNAADAVPHIPPCIPKGLKGCSEFLGLGYYHHKNEVWYPDGSSTGNSKYIVTNENEDPNGSNSLGSDFKFTDHRKYFGLDLAYYGLNNCS